MATDLNSYTQQTVGMIAKNLLPHAIIVEAENTADALFYVTGCAKAILKTDHLENHPDFFTLSPVGKINIIKIEAIRELIDRVQKTPNMGDQKVFVLFEAHRLNKNAANALLKTLEEPPADTTLFLTTHSKNFLLPTIISRCSLHHLPENPVEILPQVLQEWLDQLEVFLQKISANRDAIPVLEVFSMLEMLSQNMEKMTADGDEVKDASVKDIQRVLLETITEKIWNIFHSKSPAHAVDRMIKIVSKSSAPLAVNGSFLHVIESILLQMYALP
jgi:DNA polymerase III gamma/tau subunit